MATRHERVVLELDDKFTAGMARAAAAAALLHRELDGINGSIGNGSNSNLSALNKNLSATSRNADQTGNSINRLTGRLGLLADAAITLGPALIPIGAIATEAIGGLATAATAAAVAGGSAIVAFQGIGDAIKTVNEYTLDPTVANLKKAQEALHKLGPEAQGFVAAFQEFRPVLGDIQRSAAEGWFPGLSRSLDDFARLGPRIEDIFLRVGRAGGFITESVAESLASDRWAPFVQFIEDEVPAAMLSLSRSMGDLSHGMASLFMALDPSNDRFLGWLEDAAQTFDDWTNSAQGENAIQAFMDYARRNGPEVKGFLTALVDATTQLVQAAAPLGGPTLTALTKVLDVIARFADSDLGTPFVTALVGLRLYTRALQVAAASQARFSAATTTGFLAAGGRGGGGLRPGYAGNPGAAVFGRLGQIGKGAGLVAGAGLLASGTADDLGLTNTTMLALIGTIKGSWGAALGAAAGLALDAASANDALADSVESAGAAFKSGELVAGMQGLANAMDEQAKFKDGVDVGWFDFDVSPGDAAASLKNDIEGIFGDSDIEENAEAIGDLQAQAANAQGAVAGLGDAFNMWVAPLDGSARSMDNLNNILSRTGPAMQRAGVTVEDLTKAYGLQQRLADGTATWIDRASAAASGSMTPYDDLIDNLERVNTKMHEAISLQDTFANSLAKAQGFLSRNGAIDAAYASWNNLKKSVKENGDAFDRTTVKGQTNRAALRQMGDAIGTAAEKLHGLARTKFIDNMRGQFLQAADLLNLNKTQTDRWMRQLGLLDKQKVKPKVELETDAFDVRAKRVLEQIGELKNSKTIDSKPTTLRVGMDLADFNAGKAKVLSSTDMLAKLNPTPKVDLGTSQFFSGASGVRGEVQRLDALSPNIDVTITTTRVNRVQDIVVPRGNADGGSVPKTGLPYADRHPYLLADGEEIISNRFGQADAFRADRAAGRIPGYADGGTTGMGAPGALTNGMSPWSSDGINGMNMAAGRAAMALKGLNARLKESESALAKEQDQRRTLIDQGRSAFLTDPLAQSTDIWGGGAAGNPLAVLQNDIRNATQFQQLIKKLDKRGLGGAALGEVDSLQEAQLLASMSPSDLRRYEELYKQRQRVATSAGVALAEGSGATVAEIRRLRAEVKGLRGDIKREEAQNRKHREKTSKKNSDDVTTGMGSATRRARQRQQRNPKP